MSTALEAREVVPVDQIDQLDQAERWRYDGWLSLGFSEVQAYTLTFARDDQGVFHYPPNVKPWLEKGCTHADAFELLT